MPKRCSQKWTRKVIFEVNHRYYASVNPVKYNKKYKYNNTIQKQRFENLGICNFFAIFSHLQLFLQTLVFLCNLKLLISSNYHCSKWSTELQMGGIHKLQFSFFIVNIQSIISSIPVGSVTNSSQCFSGSVKNIFNIPFRFDLEHVVHLFLCVFLNGQQQFLAK